MPLSKGVDCQKSLVLYCFLTTHTPLITIRHENITYPKKNIFEVFSDYRFTISIFSN